MAYTATTLKVTAALETAVRHHSAGRLDEAEQLYDAVLAALPDHADALHLRGILACQRGALDHAADLMVRAITVNGGGREFLARIAGYILSCVRDGRLAWHLDQSVLYLVHRMMAGAGTPLSLAPLAGEFADSTFAPDSAVWAAKGDRKTAAVFSAEAAKFTPK